MFNRLTNTMMMVNLLSADNLASNIEFNAIYGKYARQNV